MTITTTSTSLHIRISLFPSSPLSSFSFNSTPIRPSLRHHHYLSLRFSARPLSGKISYRIIRSSNCKARTPLRESGAQIVRFAKLLKGSSKLSGVLSYYPSMVLLIAAVGFVVLVFVLGLYSFSSLQLILKLKVSLLEDAVSNMDSGGEPSLYPLHHCKTLHLVRHAQGIHNVEGDKNYEAYMSPEYFDAQITPLGWQQVDNLRKHAQSSGLFKRIDLVITSPLLSQIRHTLVINFIHWVMITYYGIAGLCKQLLEYLVVETMQMGIHPCDRRRSISDYECLFPAVDFSLAKSDEDILWKANIRETEEELTARGMKFMNWLWTRKEKEIAIVTHSGFLFHALSAVGNDCHPVIKKEISKRFANCELRSMVIVDKSMSGLDPPTMNYPGKIPPGPDAPSDVVDEKN
ncbi:hypothetical protein TEA_029377 [Camellia sinensis var. sinensis]|uniref:Phosphoglycerate mutase-like protein 1 n=1 Tax=Camellia sinensis var. sinensis TaxID=542762 RepID=A0A4S4DX94_CAMSN|nr:hypothetical protein TEA_029377 [Camellia sinensis var. sinensis]